MTFATNDLKLDNQHGIVNSSKFGSVLFQASILYSFVVFLGVSFSAVLLWPVPFQDHLPNPTMLLLCQGSLAFPIQAVQTGPFFCGWVGRVAWIQNTNRKSSLANLASLVDQYGNRFIYHSYIIICYDLMNLKWWRDSLQCVDMHSHTHTHVWHYSSQVKTNRNHTLVDKHLDSCECISMCIHWIRTIYTRCLMMFASFILNRSQLFCFLLSASCCRKSQHHFMAKTRQPLKNRGYSRMMRVDS